jgi:peptidoglycan hydrolase CwlO-like protein
MWNKIKDIFYIGVILVITVMSMMFYKMKDVLSIQKTKDKLKDTKDSSDKIDSKIEQLNKNLQEIKNNIDKSNIEVVEIHTKRKKVIEDLSSKSPDEVEDFWNKEK